MLTSDGDLLPSGGECELSNEDDFCPLAGQSFHLSVTRVCIEVVFLIVILYMGHCIHAIFCAFTVDSATKNNTIYQMYFLYT